MANKYDFTTHSQVTMTGSHRGPKQKLQAGYRVTSLKRTACCETFSSSSAVLHTVSALCMYSTFGHHPPPLGYLCAKFCLFHGLHRWASPWIKNVYSIDHSTKLIWCPGNGSFRFVIISWLIARRLNVNKHTTLLCDVNIYNISHMIIPLNFTFQSNFCIFSVRCTK